MAPPLSAPRLLVDLEPRGGVFAGNLRDLLRPRRERPLRISSRPGTFWPDVFVASPLPWRGFLESGAGHILVIAAILGISQFWPQPRHFIESSPFNHADVVYYSAADYLPPVNTGGRMKRTEKGDPVYAKQPIISVPREADNPTQTIVAPPNLKLDHDVPMPNIVSWPEKQIAVPLAATARSTVDMKVPTLPNSVIAPAPEVKSMSSMRSMHAPEAAVVEPPPTMDNSTRRVSDINIGRSEVVAPAPQLPMGEQRSVANSARPTLGGAVVPPPPSMQGTRTANSGGRLIALGIHPVEARGPIQSPGGNRSGRFAAGPAGKAGAAGTPDSTGGVSHEAGGVGNGRSGEGAGSSAKANGMPSGIFVGAGPDSAGTSAVAGSSRMRGGSESKNSRLTADATPPRVSSVPRSSSSEVSSDNATDLDKKVFGDRKFYSMSLNMPNLNSAGGSWVIRFAELKQTDGKGELIGPAVTQKVDPAYPTELMRHSVQGTVMLYAVIHSDGSVDGVRVLRGVDDRLDEFARVALGHWHFRPATRNGNAVDLEAVVMIPFKPVRLRSGF